MVVIYIDSLLISMSTGGIYQLIANDGKQDVMLTATALLNDRLKEIKKIRCKNPNVKESMPTLVDIEKTHIFFMNAHFKPFVQMGYEYQSIQPQEGSLRFGNVVSFSIPQFGDFIHDMVLHVRLEGLAAATPGDQCHYADFLGHRLVKEVRFEVNRNILDKYDSDTMNFNYNFFVPEHKRKTYLRGIGQEVPKKGYLTQEPGVDEVRELKFVLDGPQTPKAVHPVVDMWIPLMFWFNKDPRLSLLSIAIPYGQRFITVEFATIPEIAFGVPVVGGGAIIPPVGTTIELFINNIFVNPEIHDIFISRVGFSMIRVHRQERIPIDSSENEILLDRLKWPTETLYIGVKPLVNVGTATNWHKFHLTTNVLVPMPVARPNPFPPPTEQLGFSDMIYQTVTPMITDFSLETHGVELYRRTPAPFFNVYIPYRYGGSHVGSPDDIGMYMATFNLYPGAYQPSGYVNLSRSREFYFKYRSDVLTTIVSGILTIDIVAINFLLIAEGSAVLRYNT